MSSHASTMAGPMALAGSITGVISALLPDNVAGVFAPLSALFLLDGSSVHPGMLFGLGMAWAFWRSGETRAWALGVVVLTVCIAWSAALNTAFAVYDIKDIRTLFDTGITTEPSADATTAIKLLTGLFAGTVGAAIMALGCAIVAPAMRNTVAIGTTIALGATGGLLVYPFLTGWNDTLSLLILFAVWQAAVGASIGSWIPVGGLHRNVNWTAA